MSFNSEDFRSLENIMPEVNVPSDEVTSNMRDSNLEHEKFESLNFLEILNKEANYAKDSTNENMYITKELGSPINFLVPAASDACHCWSKLRELEEEKRPSPDFLEKVQKDIDAAMRADVVNSVVKVARKLNLPTESIFSAVYYMDKYLSDSPVDHQRLGLLGVACLMIASDNEKFEPPLLDQFLSIVTENNYNKDEIMRMETIVMTSSNFCRTFPTSHCFLRLCARGRESWSAIQTQENLQEAEFQHLSDYITELSLPDYTLLRYAPSAIAVAAAYLATLLINRRQACWEAEMWAYSKYTPSELATCLSDLHTAFLKSDGELKQKYSLSRA